MSTTYGEDVAQFEKTHTWGPAERRHNQVAIPLQVDPAFVVCRALRQKPKAARLSLRGSAVVDLVPCGGIGVTFFIEGFTIGISALGLRALCNTSGSGAPGRAVAALVRGKRTAKGPGGHTLPLNCM